MDNVTDCANASKKRVMHVISGTHWDREWRHTPEQSKPRLVELIETMMEVLETKPSYEYFVLDGGSVVIESVFALGGLGTLVKKGAK